MADNWNYADTVEFPAEPIAGYDVEATDGSVGCVAATSRDRDHSYVVVTSGAWIFKRERLVPAGAVRQVSPEARKVFLNVDRATVKQAPSQSPGTRARDTRPRTSGPGVGTVS
jgi:hypothetical protein